MIDIDYQDEIVKETIAKIATETGMSLEEILTQFDYFENHKTFVRFTDGVAKGKVGFYYPSPELNPYSRSVYLPDGSLVVTMGWDNSFKTISEEEYQKENEDD